jgi:DNA-binding XRE family transcriptional regulator
MTDLEAYKLQYESEFDNSVRNIVAKAQNITQDEKAKRFGVSRRTIVSFEKGETRNYRLLFCYRMHVFKDAVI